MGSFSISICHRSRKRRHIRFNSEPRCRHLIHNKTSLMGHKIFDRHSIWRNQWHCSFYLTTLLTKSPSSTRCSHVQPPRAWFKCWLKGIQDSWQDRLKTRLPVHQISKLLILTCARVWPRFYEMYLWHNIAWYQCFWGEATKYDKIKYT